MISWYHTCDQGGYGKAVYEPSAKVNAYFGLLRLDDYSPKPSYFAYQNMCALFDSQTSVSNELTMKFETTGGNRIEQASFRNLSVPICAYWVPQDVTKDLQYQPVELTLGFPSEIHLKNPVLIDPMTGVVTKLLSSKKGQNSHFAALPLKDYPMLITDLEGIEVTAFE